MAATRRSGRSRRKRPPVAWYWALGVLAVAAITAVGALVWSRTGSGQAALLNLGAESLYADVQWRLESAVAAQFAGYPQGDGVAIQQPDAHDWLLADAGPDAAIHCRVVPVPGEMSWWQVQAGLATAVSAAGGRVLWAERLPRSNRRRDQQASNEHRDLLRIDLGAASRPTHTLLLYREDTNPPRVRWGDSPVAGAWQQLSAAVAGPVVAVVIDDWGYKQDTTTDGLLALDIPLTLSILPGQAFSRHYALLGTELALPAATAARADEAARQRRTAGCPVTLGIGDGPTHLEVRRREIFLHQPMQPQAYPDLDPGPRAVMVGMSRERMESLLDDALLALPSVRGVNNHMGSAATSDAATMQNFMAVLRERDLIFLDSLTTARSVAYETALAAGLAAARNRIFLDHDHQDAEKIRRQLHELVRVARGAGFAVGIGHPKPMTMQVLRAELPRLVADGVVFVTISELLALQERGDAGGV